ncbi:hypothetical protein FBQ96_06790, partial [Nitrospirales bacterium NOB]|nr:hypothetical protein [Nitrospirales bacterium NOB]
AAIQMVQSGDYVTPRYADGSLRFRKPILTYWVLATSYATLGIGLVSSRLPFLLAACATLWVTYRLARSVTQDPRIGLLAAALLGSNILFMESATKATPDILQCLFITLSLWGATELLFNRLQQTMQGRPARVIQHILQWVFRAATGVGAVLGSQPNPAPLRRTPGPP